jgi:hypothetical protein
MMKSRAKYLILFSLCFLQFSCRDIEKNPSGCGYDYLEDSSGNCVKKTVLAQNIFKSAEKEIFQNKFFLKYIDESIDFRRFDWNYGEIESLADADNVTKNIFEFMVVKSFLQKRLVAYRAELEILNQDIYIEGLYELIDRARDLERLLGENVLNVDIILGEDFEFISDQLREKSFQERSKLHAKLELLNGEKLFAIASRSSNRYTVVLPGSLSVEGKEILSRTRDSLRSSSYCSENVDCQRVLANDVKDLSREAYDQLYIGLLID